MHARDTLAQLAGLHDRVRYARILHPGAWFTDHVVHRTPSCFTSACRRTGVATQTTRTMGLPRMQEVPA